MGTAIPEEFGGLGLGYLELCVDRGRTGPRAGAGAVLLHRLSVRGSHSAAGQRRAEEASPAEDRGRRNHRHASRARRPGRGDAEEHPHHVQGRQALRQRRSPSPTAWMRDYAVVLARGSDDAGERGLAAGARRSRRQPGVKRERCRVARSLARHCRNHIRQCQCRSARQARRRLVRRQPRARPRRDPDRVRTGRRRRCLPRRWRRTTR